jgi:cell division septation protein DedD
MTRMVGPDEHESYEEEPPRSIFSAMWFRALIVILVFGVVAAIAVPHILDVLSPPPPKQALRIPTPVAPAPGPAPRAAASTAAPPAAPNPTPAAPATSPPTAAKPETPTTTSAATAIAPQRPPATSVEGSRTEAPAGRETPPKGGATPKTDERVAVGVPAKPDPPKPSATTGAATGSNPYWVQVGAFKNPETAKRIAARLRADNYQVQESTTSAPSRASAAPAAPAAAPPAPTGGDRYNVFVSGTTAAEVNTKLSPRGLTSESVAGGVVVKPSLPLREAVTLSKDLAADGMNVQVRRAGAEPTPGPPAATAPRGTDTLHRVRVGSFPDKLAAEAVAKELESKGYKPFIARGDQ